MSDNPEAADPLIHNLPILVLVKDLIFGTRIHAAAKDVGVPTRGVRDASKLGQLDGRAVIVDLVEPGFLEAAAEWKHRTGGVVVGYASHVEKETMRRAVDAGLDNVLSRSAFVERLPQLIKTLQEN